MKATFQKAFEIFFKKETWMTPGGAANVFSEAVLALREAGFFKHLSKTEIETALKEIEKQ